MIITVQEITLELHQILYANIKAYLHQISLGKEKATTKNLQMKIHIYK